MLIFLSCLISFLAEVILWFILGLVWVGFRFGFNLDLGLGSRLGLVYHYLKESNLEDIEGSSQFSSIK